MINSSIILFILTILLDILLIILLFKKSKYIKLLEQIERDKIKELFKNEWDKEENDFNLKKAQLDTAINGYKALLIEKEKRYEEVNQDLDLYRSSRIEDINKETTIYELRRREAIETSINQYRDLETTRANEIISDLIEAIKIERDALEEERSKRAAVNEQIRKQKELEEQQDFYRIQLDPKDLDDIKILRDVAPRLRHPEAINKIIWAGYYQKPLAELRKRLLPNGDVSCIYMATRIKTLEMYIGQTTSFDKRIQEHVRTALGIGTLASSLLHRKMDEDGPEQFLWQILEVVPKDKLREREAYYIDFYKSNKFGLNTVSGDKNK